MIRNPYYLRFILQVKPDLIMHIGGHRGQDGHGYQIIMDNECRIIWAEPDLDNARVIQEKFPAQKVLTDVFWSKKDLYVNFYKSKNSEKSSAKKPIDKLAETIIEEIELRTTTIDEEMPKETKKCFLVLDVQGGEMEVLRGASKSFDQVKWIVLEITSRGVEYENVPSEKELDLLLRSKGFRKSIFRNSHEGNYKDQLYLKSGITKATFLFLIDSIFILSGASFHVIRYGHKRTTIWHCSQCVRRFRPAQALNQKSIES